ncbi:hypothetical protein [Bacillus gaemokensis]|uniref:hypothetical protein n=1 Tax=Bacillus gaemokensis TaxID=574375 RepID=UPI0005355448|nr:hypothetical protein [Bacillus gaemokensis]KYG37429.1 hypothetical protein AZF08_08480 [Bacillus gaemokensis]
MACSEWEGDGASDIEEFFASAEEVKPSTILAAVARQRKAEKAVGIIPTAFFFGKVELDSCRIV